MDTDKLKIITLFNKKVRGKKPNTDKSNAKHAGKIGHWLEDQMGIARNASNTPDLLGYEMKNHTSSKTTFGDWSADFYIWHDSSYKIVRDDFLRIFGKPNERKGGRFSWSGEPIPKISRYNFYGQTLIVDNKQNIVIKYSFSRDQRKDKKRILPKSMRRDNLILARWDCVSITKKVEQKFNHKGWFKCLRNIEGTYTDIVFGAPITFANWIRGVKSGLIFFDSGMYQTNVRNYSQWRANNAYWESLVTERY